MVVKTTKNSSPAAVHSVDPDRWWDEFGALQDRIRPRFARYEPARHAGGLMHGLLSGLDRKNCWTIAEQRGDVSPSEVSGRFCRNYLAGLTELFGRVTGAAAGWSTSWSGCSRSTSGC